MLVFREKLGVFIFVCSVVLNGYGALGGQYYRRGASTADPADDDAKHSSPDCFKAVPYYSRYGFRHYGVKVASCDALGEQKQETADVEDSLDMVDCELNDQLGGISDELQSLREDTDDLLGVTKMAKPVLLAANSSSGGTEVRMICQANNELELSEICRLLGHDVPQPAFQHVACDDPEVVNLGLTCPNSTWLFQPDCVTPNSDLRACATDPPQDFVCISLLFLSCDGFTTNLGIGSGSATFDDIVSFYA